MKLANKLNYMVEKFNGANAFFSKSRKLKFEDAESVYELILRRGNGSRGFLFFNVNGETARFFETDLKITTGTSFGSYLDGNGTYSLENFYSDGKGVENFYKTLQKNISAAVVDVALKRGFPIDALKKKIGTGKVSNDTGWLLKKDLMLILVKAGLSPSQLTAMPELQGIKLDADVKDVGGFNIIGFEKKYEPVIDILKETSQILVKNGYKNLLYGDVYLVPKGSRNSKAASTLADYSPSSDDIRMFDAATKDGMQDAVKTTAHELGHRLFHRFLTPKARQEINNKYFEMMRLTNKISQDSLQKFKEGDIIQLAKNSVKYVGYTAKYKGGSKYSYKFKILDAKGDETDRSYNFNSLADAGIALESMMPETGKSSSILHDFMPTTYAQTNNGEWFAEVFSHGLYNNSKPVIDWLKTL